MPIFHRGKLVRLDFLLKLIGLSVITEVSNVQIYLCKVTWGRPILEPDASIFIVIMNF